MYMWMAIRYGGHLLGQITIITMHSDFRLSVMAEILPMTTLIMVLVLDLAMATMMISIGRLILAGDSHITVITLTTLTTHTMVMVTITMEATMDTANIQKTTTGVEPVWGLKLEPTEPIQTEVQRPELMVKQIE